MTSLILQSATRFILPVLLLFSVFLLLRGHHEPGGGFVGGLVAAAAYALYAIAFGVPAAREALRLESRTLIGAGLLVAMASGLVAFALGQPFMTGQWFAIDVAGLGTVDIGTPLAFDLGVYITVVGISLTIIFTLAEN
jgi:multicomponent Na+:H+ antiporter subunit B